MKVKKISLVMVLGLFLSIFSAVTAQVVQASAVMTNEEVVSVTKKYPESFVFDKTANTIAFSKDKAINQGMDQATATKIDGYFNSLDDSQKATILRALSGQVSDEVNERIAPLIIWAAGVLGGWLATKLLDWGAHKFCSAYRNYNGATKAVCAVID